MLYWLPKPFKLFSMLISDATKMDVCLNEGQYGDTYSEADSELILCNDTMNKHTHTHNLAQLLQRQGEILCKHLA